MYAFTIENLPQTFNAMLNIADEDERKEVTSIVHSVWEIASYHPLVLDDVGLGAWANDASYGSPESILIVLRVLRDEILVNANTAEQYYADLEEPGESDYQEFIETIDLRAICEACAIESTGDSYSVESSSFEEISSQYQKYCGRILTEEQADEIWSFVSDSVFDIFEIQKLNFQEDAAMTANYKETVNNLNKHNNIKAAFEAAIANKDVCDEFENLLYAEVQKNPDALTEEGQIAFTKAWMNSCMESMPDESMDPETSDYVLNMVLTTLTTPLAVKIKNTAEAMSKEEFSETFETKESEIKTPEDLKKGKERKKPFKFLFKVCNKTKEVLLKALKAVKNFFISIGRAIKKAAIATGHAIEWVASKIHDSWLLATITDILIGFGIGSAVGIGFRALIKALHVAAGTWQWIALLAAAGFIAGLLAQLIDMLFRKLVDALHRRREERLNEYESIGRNVFEAAFEESNASNA